MLISFFFFFFPSEIFWCTECKSVLVSRTFFFFKHKLHAGQILNFSQYLLKRPEIDWNNSKFFQSEIRTPWTKFLESPLVLGQQFWVSPLLEKSEDLQSIAINQIHLIALLLLLFFFFFFRNLYTSTVKLFSCYLAWWILLQSPYQIF